MRNLRGVRRIAFHTVIVAVLTLLTQIGGLAWLAAFWFRAQKTAFVMIYAALTVAALFVAPQFGRVPLPCTGDGALVMHSKFYCVLNRQYVRPQVKEVLEDLATAMEQQFDGTQTLVLDGNFPFLDGFPLLPHLSHDDGAKADVAFYYQQGGAYLRGQTKSPLGYFAFESGQSTCPDNVLSLRWDMAWLQTLWPEMALDRARTRAAVVQLANDPRVSKLFLEPHLKQSLTLTSDKIRFQGCRAARHDDHIHFQL